MTGYRRKCYINISAQPVVSGKGEDDMNLSRIDSEFNVIDSLPFGVAILDHDGVIKRTNVWWKRFMTENGGIEQLCDVGASYLQACGTDTTAYSAIMEVLSGKQSWIGWDYECHSPDERKWFWAMANVLREENGRVLGAVVSHLDITDRKESELLLEKMALTDPLTKVPNRRYFMELGQGILKRADEESWMVGCLFVDCDNFKLINDQYGHIAGDKLLQVTAKRLNRALRDTDLLCRYGGDEFCVLIPHLESERSLLKLAHRILGSLQRPLKRQEFHMAVTVSVGCVVRHPKSCNLTELIHMSDNAMYDAKCDGKNRSHLVNSE